MSQVIYVERDFEGLQMAVRSLFEEALVRHRIDAAAGNVGQYELERLEGEIPAREISPGYFNRAGYLLDLSTQLELGIPIEPATLTHSDVLGIRAVRSARSEFEREHPACPRCGERQDNAYLKVCYACHTKLRGDQ